MLYPNRRKNYISGNDNLLWLEYKRCKCNLESLISIDAGSRASHMELKVDRPIDNLAIIDKNAELLISNTPNKEWSYMASFGNQSIDGEIMGLAVFYKTKQLKLQTSDELNHVVVLSPLDNFVEYYFMPTWEHDWQPIKNKESFMECVEEMMNKLNHPISIEIK